MIKTEAFECEPTYKSGFICYEIEGGETAAVINNMLIIEGGCFFIMEPCPDDIWRLFVKKEAKGSIDPVMKFMAEIGGNI